MYSWNSSDLIYILDTLNGFDLWDDADVALRRCDIEGVVRVE